MTENERRGMGGFGAALTFVCGALAGAVAALLLAPRSGDETRRRISDAAGRSRDRVGRLGVAAREATAAAREAFTDALNAKSSEDSPH
jgi:gas vesicle protein